MSANNNPIFVGGPNVKQSQAVTANTALVNPGASVASCWTTGPNGSLLSKIVIDVPGTAVADVIRFFWFDGANTYLHLEVQVTATTPGVGTNCFRYEYAPSTPEVYPTGWTLQATTDIGQTTNILVLGGNY